MSTNLLPDEAGDWRIVGNFRVGNDLCKNTELDNTRNDHIIYRFNTSVRLSVRLCVSVRQCVCLSVCPSVRPSVSLSVYQSVIHSSQHVRARYLQKGNVDTKISPKSILIHFHIIYVTKTWSQLLLVSQFCIIRLLLAY